MLKEHIVSDVDTIFFNLGEFGEEVVINGKTVVAVKDNDKLAFKIKKDYGGLIIGDLLFYISQKEWAKVPRVNTLPLAGDAISVNNRAATIVSAVCDMGVNEIIVQYLGGRM